MPSPGNNYGDMRSALKFLQDMDSYYGQIARPRSKKDDCPDDMECDPGWSRFILLQGNDDSVSRLSRPRFGKRSDMKVQSQSDKRFVTLQGADDSVSRLSRPRFGKRSDSSQSDSDPRYAMLQNVDDSVSRLSRPRFGKRSGSDQSDSDPRFLLLQGSDDSISRSSRPRFGKRSEEDNPHPTEIEVFRQLQGADDSVSRLSRPGFGKRSDGLVVVPNQSDMYVYGGPSGGAIDLSRAKYVAIA